MRSTPKLSAVLSGLCLLLGACSDEHPMDPGAPRAQLTVATYNAGLAPGFVDYAAERAPLTTAAIGALSVDVACIQELWQAEGRPQGRELQHWLEAEREILELSVAGEEDPGAGLDDWQPGDLKPK